MQFQNFAKMYGFETMSFWLVKYNAATLNRPQIILHLNQSKKSRRTWWNIFSAPYCTILITKRIFPTCLTWRSAAPSLLHLNNCLPLFGFFSFYPKSKTRYPRSKFYPKKLAPAAPAKTLYPRSKFLPKIQNLIPQKQIFTQKSKTLPCPEEIKTHREFSKSAL